MANIKKINDHPVGHPSDHSTVDNLDLNGNTISSTDTNGDIILDPNGTGEIDHSQSVIKSYKADIIQKGATNYTLTTAESGGHFHWDWESGSGYTATLPPLALGLEYTISCALLDAGAVLTIAVDGTGTTWILGPGASSTTTSITHGQFWGSVTLRAVDTTLWPGTFTNNMVWMVVGIVDTWTFT